MADAILYIHPNEKKTYTADFQLVLPSTDSTLANIAAGSYIDAYDSAGNDVGSAILASKTRTNKTLIVTLQNCDEGQDYLIVFTGEGATSLTRHVHSLRVRCREALTGEF